MVCLVAGFVGSRLWLLTPQSCCGQCHALLQPPRNAAALRGSSSAELDQPVQTLEGVLTLPDFPPYRIFYLSFTTKQINNRKRLSGYLLLSLGRVGAARHKNPADAQISVCFLTWSWWRGNVNFQVVLVILVLLQCEHFPRSGRFVVFNEEWRIPSERWVDTGENKELTNTALTVAYQEAKKNTNFQYFYTLKVGLNILKLQNSSAFKAQHCGSSSELKKIHNNWNKGRKPFITVVSLNPTSPFTSVFNKSLKTRLKLSSSTKDSNLQQGETAKATNTHSPQGCFLPV